MWDRSPRERTRISLRCIGLRSGVPAPRRPRRDLSPPRRVSSMKSIRSPKASERRLHRELCRRNRPQCDGALEGAPSPSGPPSFFELRQPQLPIRMSESAAQVLYWQSSPEVVRSAAISLRLKEKPCRPAAALRRQLPVAWLRGLIARSAETWISACPARPPRNGRWQALPYIQPPHLRLRPRVQKRPIPKPPPRQRFRRDPGPGPRTRKMRLRMPLQ